MSVIIDEKDQKEAKFKDKRNADLAKDDLRMIMASPQGRRFLWRVLGKAGLYRISAEASGSWTYFNEGKRSVGLELLADITAASPDLFITLQKENMSTD